MLMKVVQWKVKEPGDDKHIHTNSSQLHHNYISRRDSNGKPPHCSTFSRNIQPYFIRSTIPEKTANSTKENPSNTNRPTKASTSPTKQTTNRSETNETFQKSPNAYGTCEIFQKPSRSTYVHKSVNRKTP